MKPKMRFELQQAAPDIKEWKREREPLRGLRKTCCSFDPSPDALASRNSSIG
jgi:hypothetical protein